MQQMLCNCCCLSADMSWLGNGDELFFPQLLSFELDTSTSDDLLPSDTLSDSTVDSTLVGLLLQLLCYMTITHWLQFSQCAQTNSLVEARILQQYRTFLPLCMVYATAFLSQWRRVHRAARSGTGPTFNRPGRAIAGSAFGTMFY